MGGELFASSDSERSASELRHARRLRLAGPMRLEQGGVLPEVELCYETWGALSPVRDNAVMVFHALSGDSHAARHDPDDDAGWWEIMVGPGRPIDTDRFFVVCANVLGGCRGSTGPGSRHPETGEYWGVDFPTVTVGDMVDAQVQLLDHLGIERLAAVAGGSLGGHQTLAFAARHPERVEAIVALATSQRLTPQSIAFDVVGRNAIFHDAAFAGGRYYGNERHPDTGLALARMLGHITYLSQDAMAAKFGGRDVPVQEAASAFERKFSVGSYLAHQGERFVERFDANSYVALSMAMDLFDLGDDREALQRSFAAGELRWLLVSFSSDWLFPPFQMREIAEALIGLDARVTYCEVETTCGHDAFLLEDDFAIYGEMVRGFLVPEHDGSPRHAEPRPPTRLMGSERLDYQYIEMLLEPGESVLDLGCGSGELLQRLRARGHPRVMGVEISERAIVECVRRGLPVHQADLDSGLAAFPDDRYDNVILSQTLQAVGDVPQVLREMLRVGRRGIVSFPNCAHASQRERLAKEGRAPESSFLDGHRWFDEPPLRVLSVRDFRDLCGELAIPVERIVGLDTGARRVVEAEQLETGADVAIFVLGGEA